MSVNSGGKPPDVNWTPTSRDITLDDDAMLLDTPIGNQKIIEETKVAEFNEISPSSNFRMYFVLLSWIISLYILCSCVQEVTDETEKIYWNLYQCHWEDWNNENRGILLLMLVKLSNPWTLSTGFVVNKRLMVKMYRLGNALVSYFVYTLR
ncbi:uncharacterized protein isoform X1 [Leptinotarsa decemlineata]|uniref:uncharacterized protein isoform X1 n=1 Tax=Leptinotarsa decemlineata TaxID=7539 RepID=UPI003D304624